MKGVLSLPPFCRRVVDYHAVRYSGIEVGGVIEYCDQVEGSADYDP